MSLLLFPGVTSSPSAVSYVDANSGNEFTGAYAEYQSKIGVSIGGSGRLRTGVVKFGVIGDNQSDCDEKAALIVEKIAAASKGVILTFQKSLGKYRNDELPEEIEASQTQYGVFVVTNSRVSNADSDPEPAIDIARNLYLPFADLDGFVALHNELNNPALGLGGSKFNDSNKTEIAIAGLTKVKGKKLLDYTRVQRFNLVSVDSAKGLEDGVISEELYD